MKTDCLLRKATKKDIPFLARIILLAETSGHELISYQSMFPLERNELLKGFEIALNNEQEGHGLSYLPFLIVEFQGQPASAACGYIEGEHGSSNHLMTGALMTAFGTEAVLNAYQENSKYKDVQLNKSLGALQIDSVATLPEFRGKGFLKLIFDEHCNIAKQKGCTQLEIQVWSGNIGAIAAYQKLGCTKNVEKYYNSQNKQLGGKVIMSKKLV